MVEHAGVVNLLSHFRTLVPSLVPGQMFVQNISISFDPSVMDMWFPLSAGCGIMVPPPDVRFLPNPQNASGFWQSP